MQLGNRGRGVEPMDGRRGVRDPSVQIGLVDADPYLSTSVRHEFPDAAIVNIYDEPDPAAAAAVCDVVLVELRGQNAHNALRSFDGTPLIGVGGRSERAAHEGAGADAILVRPYLPHDLRRVISDALGVVEPRDGASAGAAARIRGWMGPLRLAAVALAAILQTTAPAEGVVETVALAVAFAYTTARLRLLRGTRLGVWIDLAVAVTLIVLTGGYLSPYVAFGFVVAVTSGLFLRSGESILAGGLLAMSAIPALVASLLEGTGATPLDVIVVLLLFPAAALAGGQARRLAPDFEDDSSVVLLREANRALDSLYRIARDLPRSLTLQSVAQAILEEVEDTVGANASLLLILESGVVYEVASAGLNEHQTIVADRDDLPPGLLVRSFDGKVGEHVPEHIRQAGPADVTWSAMPLPMSAGRSGWILIATPTPLQAAERRALQRSAREAGLAIDNARLFARVRDLSVDEERARLASDLHDGVAQALAHVRLELEFLSRYGPDDPERLTEDAERLVQVVQRALADVRSTIADLRAASLAGGLSVALHDHCRDMRLLAGPKIEVRTRAPVQLDPATEIEIFRIFRTALSNAIRHAGTETVGVRLEGTDKELLLIVEDDGHDLPARYDRRAEREGAGIRSMQERADQIGAELDISRLRDGGTKVTLTYPLETAERATTGTGA